MISILIKMILSCLCGGFVGLERHKKNINVGVRTYMTVCLGTTLIMIIAKRCFSDTNTGDITRMAAAAIQGVSFLGAGLIIHKQDRLEGLTTAAMLWATAIVGLAIGYGMYVEAIITTVILIFVGDMLLNIYKKEIEESKHKNEQEHEHDESDERDTKTHQK